MSHIIHEIKRVDWIAIKDYLYESSFTFFDSFEQYIYLSKVS